jgi:dimethylargininase
VAADPLGTDVRGRPADSVALVRVPSPRIAEGELTYLQRREVDLGRVRSQHDAYLAVLRGAGLELLHAPPAPEHPDGVFVEDAVVVVDDLAILTRPGAPSRRGEAETLRAVLVEHGLRIAAIEAPGTLDGGDVLQLGATVYVGRTTRTDDHAIAQLGRLLAPLGRELVPVEVAGALHLKTAATALPDGRILATPGLVSPTAFGEREVVPAEEPSGADVLLLGDTVVVSSSAPRTAAVLDRRGYRVVAVDIDELEKLEAGPTCLCVLLPARAAVRRSERGTGGQ